MKSLEIQVFSFDELEECSQISALTEHLYFLMNTAYTTDTEEEIEEREHWDLDDAKESIYLNEYLYFKNGDLIPSDQYENVIDFREVVA